MIHHIRRSILDKLATAEYKRYGELKPGDLDGNVFNYHLKGLIADDLVQKNDAGDYSLTQLGREFIVRRYENTALSAHSIFLIVLKHGSEYLFRRRAVQPLIGYTGFIHGEPEAGVAVKVSAAKRLFDKTGISDVQLSVAGSVLISQYHSDELQSFSHAIILSGQTDRHIVTTDDPTGHNFWSTLDTVEKLLPSCIDIIKMLDKKEMWLERTYNIE